MRKGRRVSKQMIPRPLIIIFVSHIIVCTVIYVLFLNTIGVSELREAASQPPSTYFRESSGFASEDMFHGTNQGVLLPEYREILTNKPLLIKCDTCAVVASSGHLLGSNAGQEIDSNKCVFRMNNAPVTGHEVDVGSRTTIRSIAHVNLFTSFHNSNKTAIEMLVAKKTRAEMVLVNWMHEVELEKKDSREYSFAVVLAKVHKAVKFYGFTKSKMDEAEQVFLNETGMTRYEANTWLSTGWFTMLAALDICNNVVVYGMPPSNHCGNNSSSENNSSFVPYHYYDLHGISECKYYQVSETSLEGGHLFITEKAIFARWAKSRKITFKFPPWPTTNIHEDTIHRHKLDTPFLHKFRKLQNQLNISFTSVKDFLKWKKLHSKPRRKMRLQKGNETFDVDNSEAVAKIMELFPGVNRLEKINISSRRNRVRYVPTWINKSWINKSLAHKRTS